MKTPEKNKGGRTVDYSAYYFILRSNRNPAWYLVFHKFGHIGTAILLALCEYMSLSKHFLLKLDSQFYAILERDHKITKEQFFEVVEYAINEAGLFDKFLFEKAELFSLDLLRNFHNSGYFRNRKYKANHILAAINFLRQGQKPLLLEDDFENIMDSIATASTPLEDEGELLKEDLPPLNLDRDLPF